MSNSSQGALQQSNLICHHESYLDRVSTTCGSRWVHSRAASREGCAPTRYRTWYSSGPSSITKPGRVLQSDFPHNRIQTNL